ncbi:MAG: DUF2809 domain-containing protein [Oscillatoria sp. PMC 1051.18]|nr:DUF2809 domain-containing protein [Oscillatoria sp. PMC 1050.18]MEC5031098.1 DUF2809 domain-containing protein [Oscillatoria sp. PMC 1051.18]
MQSFLTHRRLLTLWSLIIVTPIGLYSKFYNGIGAWWVNDYGGAILYEIFWCLFGFFFIPKRKAIIPLTFWVFGVTCALEFLQLWQTPILTAVRATFLGKMLLGTTFVWWDFPHYVIGCFLGWLWLKLICNYRKTKQI